MGITLYNTASRSLEEFVPLNPDGKTVLMYNCGPTVYNYPHIGNLRPYVFADVLRRTLEMNGYSVKQIVNITDVGHLVSDADDGEDKMEIGAKREGKSVEEIITLYSDAYYNDLKALNILPATKYPRASKYVPEQKAVIETLAAKGYTYQTSDGIYFDTNKFPRYGDFAKLDISGMQAGTRVDMGEKKNLTDFALWKFSANDGRQREQEWDSPLGIDRKGFPGWHLECSAIAMKELGEQIDIHTGGVDHIPVHHTNEIAQSECATGKSPFARFWMHSAHMMVDGQKMSKSLGNVYTLADLKAHGISPMAFRYWLLTASYRTQINFTWEALEAAQKAYNRLRRRIHELRQKYEISTEEITAFFPRSIEDDLDTAAEIGFLWKLNQSENDSNALVKRAQAADAILGLKLFDYIPDASEITPELQTILDARHKARQEKNYTESDRLRDEIRKHGLEVKDTPEGQMLEKI